MASTAIKFLGTEGTQVLVDKIKEVSTSSATLEQELGKKAPLGDDGLISSQYLPSYVDDVVEITSILADEATLPADNRDDSMLYYVTATKQLNQFVTSSKSWTKTTPEAGKIYVTKDTNLTYRWSGTELVEIGKSIGLGETEATAYPGDKGAKNASEIATVKASVAAETERAKAAEAANKKASEAAASAATQEVTDRRSAINAIYGANPGDTPAHTIKGNADDLAAEITRAKAAEKVNSDKNTEQDTKIAGLQTDKVNKTDLVAITADEVTAMFA